MRTGIQYGGTLHAYESAYFVFDARYAEPVFLRIRPEYNFEASVLIDDPNHKRIEEWIVWYSSPRMSPQTSILIPNFGGRHQLQIESRSTGKFSLQLDSADSLAKIYSGDTCEGYVHEQDSRYYVLPVDQGDPVIIDVSPQAGFDPTIAIYDTHWKLLASQNSLGSGLPEHKVLLASYTGFVFLEIGGHNRSQGQYQAQHR